MNCVQTNGSRCELCDGIEDGLIELIRLLSLQSMVEDLTCITASPSEVDVILIVASRVLE